MRFIIEHLGGVLIAAMTGGLLLLLLVTGNQAQIYKVGENMKEKQKSEIKSVTQGNFFVEEGRHKVDFAYEEQLFAVGEKVTLTECFTAKDHKGKRLKIVLEEIFPDTYRIDKGKVVFEKEGVYEVRVSAQGQMYEVCVPVVQYPE
ncbi:MAG: hypothetical protein E7277_03510 [Lachnospiraceae bacterium]|nr:hypothetical protein [Lachnospiraceae bacterium]